MPGVPLAPPGPCQSENEVFGAKRSVMNTTPALMWFSLMFNWALSPMSYIPVSRMMKRLALYHQLRRVRASFEPLSLPSLGMDELTLSGTSKRGSNGECRQWQRGPQLSRS